MIQIRRYVTSSGKDILGDWLAKLRDARAQAKITIRIDRVGVGNFGDCKPLRSGVCELRIDWGPGYRVYYAMLGKTCVLLLGGGDKSSSPPTLSGHLLIGMTIGRGRESHEAQNQHFAR
ncbi:MAG: type II toxin-antitoxin system RelE/ParE family toxin [Candidatus Sulfotelmatobacter sp.]